MRENNTERGDERFSNDFHFKPMKSIFVGFFPGLPLHYTKYLDTENFYKIRIL